MVSGLSDERLASALSLEFGIQSGREGPEGTSVEGHGGNGSNPKLVIYRWDLVESKHWGGELEIKGRSLLGMARAAFGVDLPGAHRLPYAPSTCADCGTPWKTRVRLAGQSCFYCQRKHLLIDPAPIVAAATLDGEVVSTGKTECELNGWKGRTANGWKPSQGSLFERDAYKPGDSRQGALL